MMKKTSLGMLAALVSNIFFGFSFIFTKMALNVTTPAILLAFRFSLSFIILTLIIVIGKIKIHYDKKDLPLLIIMGLFQPVIYFICENNGILNATTSFAAIMIAMVPIVCLTFSYFLLKEKVNLKEIIACIFAVGGVILISVINWNQGTIKGWGIILLTFAVFASVGFNLLSRHEASHYKVIERTYMMFIVAFISFNIIALIENFNDLGNLIEPWKHQEFIVAIIYLGIISSVFAFLLVNYANTYLPLARTTIFASFSTVVSLIAGMVILKEPFSWWIVIASIIIIGGVYAAQVFAPKDNN